MASSILIIICDNGNFPFNSCIYDNLFTEDGCMNLFIYLLLYVAFNSQGHIAMGSFTGGGNQCILHCKPPGIGK